MPFTKKTAKKAGEKSVRGEAELSTIAKAIYLKVISGSLEEIDSAMKELRDQDPYKYMSIIAKFGDKIIPTQLDLTSGGKEFKLMTDESIADGLNNIIARFSEVNE